jgi:branched-chain amino acid transport system ATP-binding protein
MSVLEVNHASIAFGGVLANHNVTIKIGEWEIVGIIGPNGAGKTTAFNIVTGFYEPDSGNVRFKGKDVTSFGVHDRTALGMGRTFQNVGMVKGVTVRDNLKSAQHLRAEYATIAGMVGLPKTWRSEDELTDRAERLIELLRLEHLLDEQVAGLPYGDLKRVELATVLATDPDVLLLDEPTSGMGPEESEELGDTLLGLRKDFGLSIAMIEHHVPMVVRICDYVYCLAFGQMLAEGKPEEVRTNPEVIRAYLGDEALHG